MPLVQMMPKLTFPDVFSLGCVFLEMLAVLCKPMQRSALEETRRQNPDGDASYQANIQLILGGDIFSKNMLSDGRCKMWLESAARMVERDPASRPSAEELKNTFGTGQDCCFMGPEPFEATEYRKEH